MKHKVTKLFIAAVLIYTPMGCWVPYEGNSFFPTTNVQGFRPVYGNQSEADIRLSYSKPLRNPGKIYLYNNLLLINELNEGIHVYDNSNPSSPQPLYFITMLGNTDMIIKDDVLYADHNGDLKAIRLNGFSSLSLQGSVSLANWSMGLPPPGGSYFECIDPSKGVVIKWEEANLKNPNCYATF
jgi:hypothetical protein